MKKNGFLIRFISVMLCITMILSMDVQTVSAMIAACEGTDIAVCEVQEGDALYEQYLSTLFYGEPTKNRLRSSSYLSSTLNEHEQMLYLAIKAQIERVAAGEIADTVFTIKDADYLRFTPEELGVESISNDNFDEWKAAIEDLIDYTKIWHNLLADCPYDLYWHDKTEGIFLDDYTYEYYEDGTGALIDTFTIRFEVDTIYAAKGVNGEPLQYQTNLPGSENLQRAVKAAENARKIVEENKNETDYNKLYNYMTKICELNTYNDDAAAEDPEVMEEEGMAPWQLIYVFDGDPNTNVVCEGYAKAFSYLCDLTEFKSPYIKCYIVNGPMDGGTGGGGGHMWNVVTMDDKKNYLVDVTNCDDDSVGAPDLLFLAALPGSADKWYTFTTEDGDETTFAYYPAMKGLYGTGADSILTLAETEICTVYQPEDDPAVSVTIGEDTTYYANIRQAMDAADGETATIKLLQDVSTTGVELYGDITIDLNGHTWTNREEDMYFENLTITDCPENEGRLFIPSDQSDPTLNVQTEYTQYGGTVLAQVRLLEGCKAYISDGSLKKLFVMDGTDVLLTGGAFDEILTDEKQTLGDLLGVGYAYAKLNEEMEEYEWMLGDEVLNGKEAINVVVREAPIESVDVSGDTKIAENGSTTLTAKAKLPEEITGDVSYQWESVSEDGTTISKVGTGQTLTLSGMTKGNYQYRLTATLDNYSVTKYVTVSVGPDAADSAASEETPPRKPEGSSGGPATDTGSTSGDPAPEKKEESTADKSPAATQTVEVDTDEAAAVVVTIKTSADGEKTAKAAVTKEISGTKTVISANLADQITKAAGTDDVTVTMTVKNEAGKTLYKVRVNTSDLEAGNKLYIYQKKSDGSYVMVNAKKYTVNKSGAVAVSMDKKATYELVNAAEADTINRQILAAVKPAAKSRTLSVGKTFRFALAKGLDPANVKTITYKTSDAATATVSKNGTVRTKSKGTVVIKAIVTLKNGTIKTVKMKVKGK